MGNRRIVKDFYIMTRFTNGDEMVLKSEKLPDSVSGPTYSYIDEIENDNQAIRQEAKDNHE